MDAATVNGAALLEDFASVLSVRSQPPSRADGRAVLSKVELRHALTSWITEGPVAVPSGSPISGAARAASRHLSPTRSASPPSLPPPPPPPPALATTSPLGIRAASPPRRSPPASSYALPPLSAQTLASHRAGATALTALVAQSEKAARENERALADADDLLSSWQQRAGSAEHEARMIADEKERLARELAQARSELASVARHNHALEER
eukprot:1382709-Prymnesium_polylepis.1